MHTTMILQGLRNLSGKEPGTVPIIGHLPIEKQYLITVSTLADIPRPGGCHPGLQHRAGGA